MFPYNTLQASTSAKEKAVRHDQKRAVVMMAFLVIASPRALLDELLACFTAEQTCATVRAGKLLIQLLHTILIQQCLEYSSMNTVKPAAQEQPVSNQFTVYQI